MKEFIISRDALFASCITALIGITTEPERAKKFQIQSYVALSTLMPETIINETDKNTLIFIIVVAQLSRNMDVEAKALEMLNAKDRNTFLVVTKFDYTKIELNEEMFKVMAKMLTDIAYLSGCGSLENGFKELEALQFEIKNSEEM